MSHELLRGLNILLISPSISLRATPVDEDDDDDDDAGELDRVNVNTATAEELMTLAGVTRPLAENLIRHRQQIGGFRYLEDIAIVNGFGAAKLNLIKKEIKLGSRNNSANSSPRARVSF